mgnify:CR=1 FL=1
MAEFDLGGYKERQPAPGVNRTNFSIRTPPQGISFGRFGGNTPLFNVTGDYGKSTAEVTPGAMGIPQEVIDRFRLQNQEQKSTSYNVGIRTMFPDGVVPDFMDKVLRPKSVNASFGRSESEFRDVRGDTFASSDRRRGIGAQGQVLRGMFGNNAPTVTGQYFEPNRSDRSFSGSVDIPMGRGDVSLYGSRRMNEGRPNDTSFGVRGKFSF